MTISIVTPCYNAERFLDATLKSVADQTFTDWEHILVDDGSTDATREVIHRAVQDDRRRRAVFQTNQGVAAARSRGFLQTDPTSDFLILLDNDDLWEPDALATLHAALLAKPECVAAYGLPRYTGDPPTSFMPPDIEAYTRSRTVVRGGRCVPIPVSEPTTFAALTIVNWITTPGQVLIRRAALQELANRETRPGASADASWSLFDANTAPADDWDLWLRLARLGPLHFEDRVVIHWRQHPNNASHKLYRMNVALRYVRHKTLNATENTAEQRSEAIAGIRAYQAEKVNDKLTLAREAAGKYDFRNAVRQVTYAGKPFVELLSTYAPPRQYVSRH